MKKDRKSFFAGILSFVTFVLIVGCSGKTDKINRLEYDFREGDIVFRRGTGAKANVVLQVDKEGLYSHVGIIVERDSEFMVVHITPGERQEGETEDRIKMEKPEQFFSRKRAKHGAVIRLKDSLEYAQKASAEAYRLYQKGITFDHDYMLEDSTKMYCTELIWKAYLSGGKDVTQGRRSRLENVPLFSGEYIYPSDIFANEEFKLIYKFYN